MGKVKRIIILLLTVFVLLVFTEKAYGEERGRLVYYKDGTLTEEEVVFSGNSTDRNCFILLKVLLKNKCAYSPHDLDVCYSFFDEGVMWISLNRSFEGVAEAERGIITEQITKTACSLKGVDSIMICVENSI